MKIRQTGVDRFHRFSKTQSVKYEIFKKLKNSKKLESILIFLSKQN
jgi:hypothetical protein